MNNSEAENFFNIKDNNKGIYRELTEGISTRIFGGEQAMISVVRIKPNATGRIHAHVEEQWGFLVEGSVKRIQNGETFDVSVGDFWRTPANVPHGVIGGPLGAVILDVFAPPRNEYLRNGSGFGEDTVNGD